MKMPPSMRKRGRPKGAGLTVIGTHKKRKQDKPVKFLVKLPAEREHGMTQTMFIKYNTDVSFILVINCCSYLITFCEGNVAVFVTFTL